MVCIGRRSKDTEKVVFLISNPGSVEVRDRKKTRVAKSRILFIKANN